MKAIRNLHVAFVLNPREYALAGDTVNSLHNRYSGKESRLLLLDRSLRLLGTYSWLTQHTYYVSEYDLHSPSPQFPHADVEFLADSSGSAQSAFFSDVRKLERLGIISLIPLAQILQTIVGFSVGMRNRAEEYEAPQKPTSGFVYVVGTDEGFFKIGKTTKLEPRMQALHVHLPFKHQLLHTIACRDYSKAESSLHRKFKDKRVHGEWFKLSPEDVAAIKAITTL